MHEEAYHSPISKDIAGSKTYTNQTTFLGIFVWRGYQFNFRWAFGCKVNKMGW